MPLFHNSRIVRVLEGAPAEPVLAGKLGGELVSNCQHPEAQCIQGFIATIRAHTFATVRFSA
jgi:hypothetical protein